MIFTLEFGDYTFPNQTFEIQNASSINNVKEENIVRQHGAVIQTPFLSAKRFTIKGIIHNTDRDTSLSELDSMQQNLLNNKDYLRDRSDREIEAYTKKIVAEPELGTDQAVINIRVDMTAPVPFFTAVGASTETAFTLVDGVCLFDLAVAGNAFNEPKIYIHANGGTINDDFQLFNITNNNQLFKFRGVIADGETVIIDSKDLTVLNNGVDGISDFEGDFINLLAGTNEFSFGGSTCLLTFERKGRWY